MSSDQADLKHDVADELTLAESSHPEEAMREPIEHWLFDPTEALRYVAVLRGLLGAAGARDRPDALPISLAGRRSDYSHQADKESAYSQACPRDGGAKTADATSTSPLLTDSAQRRSEVLDGIQRSPQRGGTPAAGGTCPIRTLVPPSSSPLSSSPSSMDDQLARLPPS
jgi:hypothetical protein